ncbi:hypothetical protein [Microcystis aeruginosa]|uniref:hypothetical protein n=1 Tax=Microcystis aeruginosa TaxID=1126 RepID=UPI0002F91D6B|nr:hypothetical protein [Microcystis aeruginosa]
MTRSWQTNKINFLVEVGKWVSGEVGKWGSGGILTKTPTPQHPKTLTPKLMQP